MSEWHECEGEEEQWITVYKPHDEWVLRSDSGNIPVNHCPYCGMKLIETEESVNVSKFVKFQEGLHINVDKIIAVAPAVERIWDKRIIVTMENGQDIVLDAKDLESVTDLIE